MLKNIPIRVATSAERYCGGEQKWWSQPVSRPPCTPNQQAIANYSKLYPGGPIPHNLARALMPRQPYSVAVLSTGGRLHPRFLRFLSPTRGTEGVVKTIERGLGRKWSSLWKGRRRDSKNDTAVRNKKIYNHEILFINQTRSNLFLR